MTHNKLLSVKINSFIVLYYHTVYTCFVIFLRVTDLVNHCIETTEYTLAINAFENCLRDVSLFTNIALKFLISLFTE